MIPRRHNMQNMKGFQAAASVPINSPSQNNNQNVNVIVSDSSLTKDRAIKILTNKNTELQQRSVDCIAGGCVAHGVTGVTDINPDSQPLPLPSEEPLDDKLESPIRARTIETAKEGLEEFRALIKDQNNLIEALSLILDLYERNPLIVNKCIIAEEEELSRLLFLLTNADQIEMVKTEPEMKCCAPVDKFTYIHKIMVKKNGNTVNFKYSYPNVVQLLENRHISYKMVI